jgi:hypothetical protein
MNRIHGYLETNRSIELDRIVEEQSCSTTFRVNENLLRTIEQANSSERTFSVLQSMQNLFQRFLKLSSPSAPSTPTLSHSDQLSFRIRPFPMSSYDNESSSINPCNKRFYHVFKHGELEMLINEASKTIVGSRIIQSYYDHGNWCAIVQRDVNMS